MKLSRTLVLAALSTGLGLGLPTPWQSFPGGFSVEAAATRGQLDPLTTARSARCSNDRGVQQVSGGRSLPDC